MEKKIYVAPAMRLVKAETTRMIATSGQGTTVSTGSASGGAQLSREGGWDDDE